VGWALLATASCQYHLGNAMFGPVWEDPQNKSNPERFPGNTVPSHPDSTSWKYTTLSNRDPRMQRVDMKGPLLLWILGFAGLLTAIWMGNRLGFIGYVIGFASGAAMMLGILSVATLTWISIQGLLFHGLPRFPACRNGCCRGGRLTDPGDYTTVWNDDWTVRGFRCRCGVTYRKVGRRFVELAPDGSFMPYLIWNPLRGWCPDPQTEAG
jgi:hypothetical protein